jgi:hypothetical protein
MSDHESKKQTDLHNASNTKKKNMKTRQAVSLQLTESVAG